MKILTTLLALAPLYETRAQDHLVAFDNIDAWAGQTKYDFPLQKRFDEYCRKNELMAPSFELIVARGEHSWKYTRAADINDDGLQDIVYSGPSGGEPNIDIPSFTKVFQSIEVGNELVKPKSYFPEPIEFRFDNDGYELRLAPKIDDETSFESLDIKGNTIAIVRKGTTGKAWASKADETGREWWYVSIPLHENVQNSLLAVPDKFPTQIIGWLSSRFVTTTGD